MDLYRADVLSGKTALVTGSSRGLGRAIATALASYGATVAFHGRQAPQDLANEYRGVALGADLSVSHAGSLLVQEAVARLGQLDILVNCAAGRTDGRDVIPQEDGPPELYRPVIVGASQDASLAALKSGVRHVVNVGSIAGFAGPDAGGYGVAKAELHALTRHLAKIAAPTTLVNCVAPGPVEAGGGLLLTPEERADYTSAIPLQRLATSDDVTNLVLFLVSGAADYLTGQVISLTGGWVMS
jgi:3-oxoacyl-[acyl-carrier protein] reductase